MVGQCSCQSNDQIADLGPAQRERLDVLLGYSPHLVFVVAEDGALSYISPAVRRLAGFDVGEPPWTNINSFLSLMGPSDMARIQGRLRGSAPPGWQRFCLANPDGSESWVELHMSDERNNPVVGGWLITGCDITSKISLEAELNLQARTDDLTGLPNRRALNEALELALGRASRVPEDAALVLLDLDGFKGVNDTLGHPIGDALLIKVAHRLQKGSRQGEFVSRLSGDEFAIVLEGIGSDEQAKSAATRLADLLKTPFEVEGQLLSINVSGGVLCADGLTDKGELFRRADIALYEAKSRGRGRVELFEPAMQELLINQARLKREIKNGIANNEFSLVYQPLLTVAEQSIAGFEALMRWHSPALGQVPPLTFIPACESSGMILELGRWALLEACSQLAEWQESTSNPDLTMSVNVSVVQLADADFFALLKAALTQSGIAPNTLQLEITESVIANSVDGVVEKLAEVRSMGVRIALDDFGTGYSSMGQLQLLPVDCIKIDRSFINALKANDKRAGSVVNAMVELGRALGLQVIAEGIEELEQLTALVDPGCDLAQGFLLARPMSATEVPDFIKSRLAQTKPA